MPATCLCQLQPPVLQPSESMMPSRSSPYVLVVEDHPLVAESLVACVQACDAHLHTRICGTLAAAREALQQHADVRLIVTDLNLPDAHGMESVQALRQAAPQSALLVCTALQDTTLREAALALGAVGYLVKSSSTQLLRSGIAAALAPTETRRAGRSAPAQPLQALLTARQVGILEELSTGRSNKEIAARMGISPETVASHMKEILARLGVRNRTEAVAQYLRVKRQIHG